MAVRKLLSVVVVGRDDGYGDTGLSPFGLVPKLNFMERLVFTIKNNVQNFLTEFSISEIQYIIVDWSPVEKGRFIYKNEYFQNNLPKLVQEQIVKHVIVDPEAVRDSGHSPKKFYEYYAKNVGIRQSDEAEYCLITNPDIFIPLELTNKISKAIKENDPKKYYRPYSRIDCDEQLNKLAEGIIFTQNGLFQDQVLGTPASGDFTMAKTETLVNLGKGYNELSSDHRTSIKQSSMDGELIWNLYNNGVMPSLLTSSILHLDHSKDIRGGSMSDVPYENSTSWGMLNYLRSKIESNVFLINNVKSTGV
jgi:hypothetical protein